MNKLLANTPVAHSPEAQDPAEVARELIRRKQAAGSLIKYAQFIDEKYSPFSVHYSIAEKLQDVEQGLASRAFLARYSLPGSLEGILRWNSFRRAMPLIWLLVLGGM